MVAIFGSSHPQSISGLTEVVKTFSIPYFSWSDVANERLDSYYLNLFPDFTPTVTSIIQHYKWNKIFYVFNHENGKKISK